MDSKTQGAVIGGAIGCAGGAVLAKLTKNDMGTACVAGAVVGGAMFGDNLSMISDTTIAATRSQRCEMRDKFRVNFLIALPAALITLVLLLIFGRPETVMPLEALPFDLISDPDETACTLFGVMKLKNMYGKQVRGIERSTFVIDAAGILRREWRGVKVPGHAQEVLDYIKTL